MCEVRGQAIATTEKLFKVLGAGQDEDRDRSAGQMMQGYCKIFARLGGTLTGGLVEGIRRKSRGRGVVASEAKWGRCLWGDY